MPTSYEHGDRSGTETTMDSVSSADTILDRWTGTQRRQAACPWLVVGRLLDHFARTSALGTAVAAWAQVAESARKRRRDALFDAMGSQVQEAKRCCRGLEASVCWTSGRRAAETSATLAWRAVVAWRDTIRQGDKRPSKAVIDQATAASQGELKVKIATKHIASPARAVARKGSMTKSLSAGALVSSGQQKGRLEKPQLAKNASKIALRRQRPKLDSVPEIVSKQAGTSTASAPSCPSKCASDKPAPESLAPDCIVPLADEMLPIETPCQAGEATEDCRTAKARSTQCPNSDLESSFDTWPVCNSDTEAEATIHNPIEDKENIVSIVSMIEIVDCSAFDLGAQFQVQTPGISDSKESFIVESPVEEDLAESPQRLTLAVPAPAQQDEFVFDPPTRAVASSSPPMSVHACSSDGGSKAAGHPSPLSSSRSSTPCRPERPDTDSKLTRGPERFFYDTSSYTGCARYGGPLAVDRCAESPTAGPVVWADALRGSSCRSFSQTREEKAGMFSTPRRSPKTSAAGPPPSAGRRRATVPALPTSAS